jgi:autotransporter-associated beta strand protein
MLGSKALTVGLNNLSTTVAGTISDGGVAGGTGGSLVKVGMGTLTLSGVNTYSGGTSFNGGILAVNNDGNLGSGPLSFNGGTLEALAAGGGITSSKPVTLNAGGGTFLADAGTASTLSGAISGVGSFAKNGGGILILSGTNSYSGGTTLNAGTLTVNNAQALGLGNVVVNGGTLRADPQPINVKGNYIQNSRGTLQLQGAGANPGQYDTLNVGGNAALGGTLQLVSIGFQPKGGNRLTLVNAGGEVTNRFGHFLDPFAATGPGYNTVELVYGRNSVLLRFVNFVPPAPPPVVPITDFASFALTPDQKAAANLLDAVQLDPASSEPHFVSGQGTFCQSAARLRQDLTGRFDRFLRDQFFQRQYPEIKS